MAYFRVSGPPMRMAAGLVGLVLVVGVLAACNVDEQEPRTLPPPPAPDSFVTPPSPDSPDVSPTPQETPTAAEPGDDDLVALGQAVSQQAGCGSCHGTALAPDFEGLFGSERMLQSGETVIADEEYIRRSIVDPDAEVTEGYQAGVMPRDFEQRLSDEEIDALVAYIESLR